MNIAFFLKPKASVAFLYSDYTLRQALEKMRHYGYTAIPVINREGKYISTVSEGDFLWYFLSLIKSDEEINKKLIEDVPLTKILKPHLYKPVKITADMDELLAVALSQNFVPVTDDFDSFIGIVTRRDIIKNLNNPADKNNCAV